MIVAVHSAALDAIRSRLSEGEFSEAGLARRAGLSQSYVHLVLAGRRHASAWALSELLDAARVPATELFAAALNLL